jgi:hypothetical protein
VDGRACSLNKNQRGFVRIDGTLSNVLVLQSFLDYNSAKRRRHALASLDLRKAFDSVSHHSVARSILHQHLRTPTQLYIWGARRSVLLRCVGVLGRGTL